MQATLCFAAASALAVSASLMPDSPALAADPAEKDVVYEGTIQIVEGQEIQLQVGKIVHTIAVTPQTMTSVNGTEATIRDIRPGYLGTVVVRHIDGKMVARIIDARIQTL